MLVKANQMGGFWILTNRERDNEIKYEMFLKEWELNIAKGGEAIILLGMVETISNKAQDIEDSSVLIWNNNRLLVNEINNQDLTESQFV